MCAETIKAAAIVCRYCGFDFRNLTSSHSIPPPTNGMAIASLVLGILWLYGIGSILALVFGYTAKRQIAASRGRQGGAGMATAGIILGWIGVAGALIAVSVVASMAS